MDIEDLERQGIQVDDDNDPAPENSSNPPNQGAAPPLGTWEKPTISLFADNPGKWKNHRWDVIAEYDELCLFCLCFLEKWIINVLIPTTNKELVDKLSLQEFYVFWESSSIWLASMGLRIESCGGQPSQSTCSVVLHSGSMNS